MITLCTMLRRNRRCVLSVLWWFVLELPLYIASMLSEDCIQRVTPVSIRFQEMGMVDADFWVDAAILGGMILGLRLLGYFVLRWKLRMESWMKPGLGTHWRTSGGLRGFGTQLASKSDPLWFTGGHQRSLRDWTCLHSCMKRDLFSVCLYTQLRCCSLWHRRKYSAALSR